MPPVARNKMEVIAGNTERTREAWRPQADKGAFDISETELALNLGGVDQTGPRLRRIDRARANPLEASVQPNRVKDVSRTAIPVAAGFQLLEARNRRGFGIDLRRETRDHRKRRAGIGGGFRYGAGALDLVDTAVEHHHLAVQIGEGAEPEITVLQDRLDANLLVVDACDQRAGNGNLKQRMHRYAKIFGQSCGD